MGRGRPGEVIQVPSTKTLEGIRAHANAIAKDDGRYEIQMLCKMVIGLADHIEGIYQTSGQNLTGNTENHGNPRPDLTKGAVPPPEMRAEVEKLVRAGSLRSASTHLEGVSRESIARVVAGLPVRAGTIALIADILARRSEAKKERA